MARVSPSAEVIVVTPLAAPERYPLVSETVTIGRANDCTIPVRDRYLSRKHAELVAANGSWVLKDCGSANGTYVNGTRVEQQQPLRPGDRIRLGDTEIVFQTDQITDRFLAIAESRITPTISIPLHEITAESEFTGKNLERLQILNALAVEMIEERPLDELFGFIVERVMDHLHPSRAAIGLLSEDGKGFATVEVRREDEEDTSELSISRTLLQELVEEKKALAFIDVAGDEKLSRAASIIIQGIHSVLCAPLMIGESVVGVLYVDFLFTQRSISEEDVRLVGQIARFAAIKLENTRLREDAIQKRLMDEELKTAYLVQRRLLPEAPPAVAGYSFAGVNRPCRSVSGDYFDFLVRPDGSVYFVIADVSGKGVTAGLIMAGLQTAFRIYAKEDPTPAELVTRLNQMLKENLPHSKFVTLFAGRLHPESGRIEFTNAGHTPPIFICRAGASELQSSDLLLGMFARVTFTSHEVTLEPGDALVLFTDGVSEAENAAGVEIGTARLQTVARELHGETAETIGGRIQDAVSDFAGGELLDDDLTLVVISRDAAG